MDRVKALEREFCFRYWGRNGWLEKNSFLREEKFSVGNGSNAFVFQTVAGNGLLGIDRQISARLNRHSMTAGRSLPPRGFVILRGRMAKKKTTAERIPDQ